MIGHEHIRVDETAVFAGCIAETIQVELAVRVCVKDRLPVITPLDDVWMEKGTPTPRALAANRVTGLRNKLRVQAGPAFYGGGPKANAEPLQSTLVFDFRGTPRHGQTTALRTLADGDEPVRQVRARVARASGFGERIDE